MRAVQIKSYGDPLEVLEVVDVPEPGAPGANEALLGSELATLNRHDLLFIRNALGSGPGLPTIVATKGSGGSSPSVAASRTSRLAIACLHQYFRKPGVRK